MGSGFRVLLFVSLGGGGGEEGRGFEFGGVRAGVGEVVGFRVARV